MTAPVRLVVAIVGVALVLAVLIIGALAIRGQSVPDVLQNIAVGAITGLLGLLVQGNRPTPPPGD